MELKPFYIHQHHNLHLYSLPCSIYEYTLRVLSRELYTDFSLITNLFKKIFLGRPFLSYGHVL